MGVQTDNIVYIVNRRHGLQVQKAQAGLETDCALERDLCDGREDPVDRGLAEWSL
jgi:hypothetical protein